jgi:hypothetical protein
MPRHLNVMRAARYFVGLFAWLYEECRRASNPAAWSNEYTHRR